MAWMPNAGDLPWLNLFPRDPNRQAERQLSTRRQLLIRTLATGATVAAGAALASCAPSGAGSGPAAALPPPEATTLRRTSPFACDPPLWLAKGILGGAGFRAVPCRGGRGGGLAAESQESEHEDPRSVGRQAMVAVRLLHARREPRLDAAEPGSDQARHARHHAGGRRDREGPAARGT